MKSKKAPFRSLSAKGESANTKIPLSPTSSNHSTTSASSIRTSSSSDCHESQRSISNTNAQNPKFLEAVAKRPDGQTYGWLYNKEELMKRYNVTPLQVSEARQAVHQLEQVYIKQEQTSSPLLIKRESNDFNGFVDVSGGYETNTTDSYDDDPSPEFLLKEECYTKPRVRGLKRKRIRPAKVSVYDERFDDLLYTSESDVQYLCETSSRAANLDKKHSRRSLSTKSRKQRRNSSDNSSPLVASKTTSPNTINKQCFEMGFEKAVTLKASEEQLKKNRRNEWAFTEEELLRAFGTNHWDIREARENVIIVETLGDEDPELKKVVESKIKIWNYKKTDAERQKDAMRYQEKKQKLMETEKVGKVSLTLPSTEPKQTQRPKTSSMIVQSSCTESSYDDVISVTSYVNSPPKPLPPVRRNSMSSNSSKTKHKPVPTKPVLTEDDLLLQDQQDAIAHKKRLRELEFEEARHRKRIRDYEFEQLRKREELEFQERVLQFELMKKKLLSGLDTTGEVAVKQEDMMQQSMNNSQASLSSELMMDNIVSEQNSLTISQSTELEPVPAALELSDIQVTQKLTTSEEILAQSPDIAAAFE